VSKTKIGRKEQRQIEEAQKSRKQLLSLAIPAVLIVGAIVAVALLSGVGSKIQGIVDLGTQGQGHDAGVEIEDGPLPPAGGTHSPQWQTCGIYDTPVGSENAVHSMEHGAVWITYRSDMPAADIETLRGHARGQSYLLLSPYPTQESAVVLTAWGIQLALDSVEDERIAQFIDDYRLGPQTPEFGASCDGGVGQPLG